MNTIIGNSKLPKSVVYLSRRNLLTLLAKLDRAAQGDDTACAIIKSDDMHEKYPQTMREIMVCAVEDAEYYNTRSAGAVHHLEELALKQGVQYDTV